MPGTLKAFLNFHRISSDVSQKVHFPKAGVSTRQMGNSSGVAGKLGSGLIIHQRLMCLLGV